MAKIKIREIATAAPATPDATEHADPGVATRGLFTADDDPIHARVHTLESGQRFGWEGSERGHLAYVWEGSIHAGKRELPAGSMVLIEHGGSADVIALQPTTLLVFNTSAASRDVPNRAGGHAHLLAAGDAPHADRLNDNVNVGGTMFADSGCPTCELWLHGNDFHDPGFVVKPHYHSEDEVIVVTDGEIVLGARRFGRGTAIAVQRDTIYGFRVGEAGLSFINFRPSHPSFGFAGQKDPIDERGFYERLSAPTYVEVA